MVSLLTSALSWLIVAGLSSVSGKALAEPLSEAEAKLFLGSREDKPAELLHGITADAEGQHYVTGNEWNLHLFYPPLKDLGGAYLGVGSDQAYLFIGWQKPTLAWLIDYDPVIIQIHGIYHAFFAAAATPNEFRALWDPESDAVARAALVARWGERKALPLQTRLRTYRKRIAKRLDRLGQTMREAAVPSFLTDDATYKFVRDFIVERRARPMLADLLQKRGMRGIGKAARELGVTFRVVYLSNAEEYWNYSFIFRQNMESLPHDEGSFLVRTLLTWERNQDYRYNLQPYANFLRWLQHPAIGGVRHITGYRKDDDPRPDLLITESDPPPTSKK
jgi:hypothetical protein